MSCVGLLPVGHAPRRRPQSDIQKSSRSTLSPSKMSELLALFLRVNLVHPSCPSTKMLVPWWPLGAAWCDLVPGLCFLYRSRAIGIKTARLYPQLSSTLPLLYTVSRALLSCLTVCQNHLKESESLVPCGLTKLLPHPSFSFIYRLSGALLALLVPSSWI